MEATALTDIQIDVFIGIANRMVTERLGSEGLSADLLKDIESFLTAHLIAIGKERQAIDERIDNIQASYQGVFGEGLKSTTYGQMVLTLDTTGLFAKAGKTAATIRSIYQVDQ